MATKQIILLGVPAFVGEITGKTTCRFWYQDSDFDRKRLIEVDLAKDTNLDSSQWDTGVDVDSSSSPGLTTIGPTFHSDSHKGAVYLSQRLVKKYRDAGVLNDWPPTGETDAQYQVALRAGTPVTRFYGFRAKLLVRKDPMVKLAFYETGKPAPTRQLWLDLSDQSTVDPSTNGLTTLDAATPVGTDVSVFLPRDSAVNLAMSIPKLPPGFGTLTLERMMTARLDPVRTSAADTSQRLL